MKPEIAYVFNKLKQLRFDFHKTDFSDFRNNYRYDPILNRYVRKDDNDLFIDKNTFKPLEEELEYADKCHTLEQELGCPLEVRCNVYTGVKVFDKNGKKYNASYTYKDGFATDENRWFAWETYKKTWWLREDKSE